MFLASGAIVIEVEIVQNLSIPLKIEITGDFEEIVV